MSDSNSEKTVNVDTDNLDDFEDLFQGRAKEASEEPEAKEEVVQNDDLEEVEALATDEDNDEPEEEVEAPKPKKVKKSYQERINELTARAREAERKLEEALAVKQDKKEDVPVKAPEDKAPSPDDKDDKGEDKYPLGEFDPQYVKDLVRHENKLAREAAREEVRQQLEAEKARERQEQLSAKWKEKIEKAEAKYEDLHEKTAELEDTFNTLDPQFGEFIASTIMTLEYGPDVLYYLSDNLDEARKIVTSDPLSATIALGRIDARVAIDEERKQKKPPKVSAAPSPPPTNKGISRNLDVAPDTDDLDAFSDMFFAKRR